MYLRGIVVRLKTGAARYAGTDDALFLGVSGTARASFYIYNTKDEVEVLVEALKAARDFFK